MRLPLAIRRIAGMVLAAGLFTSALVAGGPPASAGTSPLEILSSSWAYTDSRAVHTSTADGTGDAPVGAWRDDSGKLHLSKSYFTLDLSALVGARIFDATASVAEHRVNNCDQPRATQLWLTDTAEKPTWDDQPEERAMLPALTATPGCPSPYVTWDAAGTVRQALAAGRTKITLALLIPEDQQGDLSYGRAYANDLRIAVRYNNPPGIPTELTLDFQACDQPPVFARNTSPELRARLSDPNPTDRLRAHFAVWPDGQPEQRTTVDSGAVTDGTVAMVSLPNALSVENQVYDFAVQADDGDDVSAWSAPCQYTVDTHGPAAEPTVTSPNYPDDGALHFGVGASGSFTFGANGAADAVGFYYGSTAATTYVAADQPGGNATVSYTPQNSGLNRLYVQSADAAGNRSPVHQYSFYVQDTQPRVTVPNETGLGSPVTISFSPTVTGVVSYTYQLDAGPQITVPAVADGTASVSVTPAKYGGHSVSVWSSSPALAKSGVATRSFFANDAPLVSGDVYPDHGSGGGPGVPGTFTLTPRMPNVTGYVYYVNWPFSSDPPISVPANPDGTATFVFTPPTADSYDLTVFAQTADGTLSQGSRDYTFTVN
ncbi:hypothetical protein, partial [Amycolatopsis rhizosphaerae]|uniref:hypothetical protein n=1 Tax=Amycolatopsis rhizosphaerae TaxID=2053003 RepID=UPI0016436C9E